MACEVVSDSLVVSYANDDFKFLLGIPNRAVCGQPLLDVLDTHLDDTGVAALRGAVLSERGVVLDLVGTEKLLALTLRPPATGEFWRGTLRPVSTDTVRIEAASLRARPGPDAFANVTAQDARHPAIVFDLTYELGREDYRVDSVSESCVPLVGVQSRELIETGLFPSLARPQDLERLLSALALAAHGRRRFEQEFPLLEPKRRFAWVRVVADAYPGGADSVRFAGVIVDATGPRAAYEHLSEVLGADRAQLRASAAELRESRERIRCLEAEVSEVSHRERERIGHDLNDGLVQELIGLSMLFRTLEDDLRIVPGDYASRVESIRDILDQCATATRTLAQAMSPVDLEKEGLASGLRQLVLSFETLHDIEFALDCAEALPALDEASAANLYRIVQEALDNAVKHAEASRIAVHVDMTPGEMTVEIEDDGIGLGELGTDGRGMGLKIMRYRAGMLGARIEFTRGPTGGTLVKCAIKTSNERIAGVET